MLSEGLEEAIEFSEEMPKINLCAIVHENIPKDIVDFMRYFSRKSTDSQSSQISTGIYLDGTKGFNQAQGYRIGSIMDVFSARVRQALSRARGKGIEGTLSGDGRLLGGLLVVGSGKIWYEYREENYGDLVIIEHVIAAIYEAIGRPSVASRVERRTGGEQFL